MTKLYEHQKEILSRLSANGYYAILAEQGTGKTLPTLKHIAMLCRYGKASPEGVLIVAPLSALGAWREGITLLTEEEQAAVEGIVLVNYDKLSRETSPLRKDLWHEWDVIVLDEAHAISSNPLRKLSNRTKYFTGYKGRGKKGFVAGLNALAKRRYILTGTLVANGRLEDLYSPLEFLNPGGLGTWKEFADRYLRTFRPPMAAYEMVIGYRNTEELEEYLEGMSFRVLKKDCLDLPEKFPDTVITVPLAEKTVYKQATEHFIDHKGIEIVMDNPLVTMTKLRQVASGFVYDEQKRLFPLKSDKPKYLTELVESILPHKVVVFCQFTHSIDEVAKVFDKMGVRHIVQDGRTADKDAWRAFNADPDIGAIIVQYKSGSSGINLQAATHTVFYEPPLSTTDIEQAKDRTHRIGVASGCNYYFLLVEKTIEEHIYQNLRAGIDFTAEFFARTYDRNAEDY